MAPHKHIHFFYILKIGFDNIFGSIIDYDYVFYATTLINYGYNL